MLIGRYSLWTNEKREMAKGNALLIELSTDAWPKALNPEPQPIGDGALLFT